MLLAVDVGNTQSHVGVFEERELVAHWRFATEADDTADELAVRVSALVALGGLELGDLDGSIVSSVVPQLTPEYADMSDRYLADGCVIVGPGGEDGNGDPAGQPARAGSRPARQRGGRVRTVRRAVRRGRLRHRDHLRRRVRRGGVPGRRD